MFVHAIYNSITQACALKKAHKKCLKYNTKILMYAVTLLANQ